MRLIKVHGSEKLNGLLLVQMKSLGNQRKPAWREIYDLHTPTTDRIEYDMSRTCNARSKDVGKEAISLKSTLFVLIEVKQRRCIRDAIRKNELSYMCLQFSSIVENTNTTAIQAIALYHQCRMERSMSAVQENDCRRHSKEPYISESTSHSKYIQCMYLTVLYEEGQSKPSSSLSMNREKITQMHRRRTTPHHGDISTRGQNTRSRCVLEDRENYYECTRGARDRERAKQDGETSHAQHIEKIYSRYICERLEYIGTHSESCSYRR